ncbi:MAG: hypothetical protein FJY15_08430 [Bacteroidetes bacterium]|nr:hypothetical protein [Bacteroidota bacterium]
MSQKEPDKAHSDYYCENGYLVFTEYFLLKRGICCGSACRHCPFEPKHNKGNKHLCEEVKIKHPTN